MPNNDHLTNGHLWHYNNVTRSFKIHFLEQTLIMPSLVKRSFRRPRLGSLDQLAWIGLVKSKDDYLSWLVFSRFKTFLENISSTWWRGCSKWKRDWQRYRFINLMYASSKVCHVNQGVTCGVLLQRVGQQEQAQLLKSMEQQIRAATFGVL